MPSRKWASNPDGSVFKLNRIGSPPIPGHGAEAAAICLRLRGVAPRPSERLSGRFPGEPPKE